MLLTKGLIRVPEKDKQDVQARSNPCTNCDSTSMEVCLLIRHCKYWANPEGKLKYR